MSVVPQELRDAMVRRLEEAVADRDRKLAEVRHQSDQLRAMLGNLEGQLQRQQILSNQVAAELRETDAKLREESEKARRHLENLRHEMNRQHAEISAALEETEKRHRREWAQLQREIDQLAHERLEKERRLRSTAQATLERAENMIESLAANRVEALDLIGQMLSSRNLAGTTRHLMGDPRVLPAELLSSAMGCLDAARRLEGLFLHRDALLAEHARRIREGADLLEDFLKGKALGSLPDQQAEIEDMMKVEVRQLQQMIARFIRSPAESLSRWNGHASILAKLDAIQELFAVEIGTMRTHLLASLEHEQDRYVLSHIEDDLAVHFGRRQRTEGATPGAWSDPEDRKSTYLYFLSTPAGEVRVTVPWVGQLEVIFEGKALQFPSYCQESSNDPAILWLGNLRKRWDHLAERLKNPNWDPDLAQEEKR